MKTITLRFASATAIAAIMATQAFGADIYQGGLKDAPYTPDRALWTGWTATVGAGWANHNFDTSRTIHGSLNHYSIDTKGEDRKSACRGKWADVENWNDICGTDFTADDTIDPVRYEIPLAESHFSRNEELDESGFQGSFELGRRLQNSGFIFEAAIGVSVDAAGAASSSYDTQHAITIDPDGLFGGPVAVDPDDFALTGVGSLSVEKTHDIYAVIGAGVPLGSDQRLAIGARGGVVLGFFDVKGAHHFDGDADGDFDTAFSGGKSKIGGIVEGYARYKLTDNVDAGLLVSYKAFSDIKAGDSAEKDFPLNVHDGDNGLVGRVNDRVSINPSEWAVKGTLTYTFDE